MSTDSLLIPKIRWVFPWNSGVSNKSNQHRNDTAVSATGAFELSKRWHPLHFLRGGGPGLLCYSPPSEQDGEEPSDFSDPLGRTCNRKTSKKTTRFKDAIKNGEKNCQKTGFAEMRVSCLHPWGPASEMVVGSVFGPSTVKRIDQNATIKLNLQITRIQTPNFRTLFPASETLLTKNSYVSNGTVP